MSVKELNVEDHIKFWFNWLSNRGYLKVVGGSYQNGTFEEKYSVTDKWQEASLNSLDHLKKFWQPPPKSDDEQIDLLSCDMATNMLLSAQGFFIESELLALAGTIVRINRLILKIGSGVSLSENSNN